jgi:hypothetical protein
VIGKNGGVRQEKDENDGNQHLAQTELLPGHARSWATTGPRRRDQRSEVRGSVLSIGVANLLYIISNWSAKFKIIKLIKKDL